MIVWASSWQRSASLLLGPFVGLPEGLPYINFDRYPDSRLGESRKFPPQYWRDEFTAGEPSRVVQVFEAFEFVGPFQARYTFAVFEKRDDKEPIGRIQLESMDSDTQIARELGTIGPDQRVYRLDWNGAGGHRTYNYFDAEPQYDELKKMVLEILEGKVSPASSTYRVK